MTVLQIVAAIASMLGLAVSLVTLGTVLVKAGRMMERDDRQQRDIDMLFKWHRESVELADGRWREIGISLERLAGAVTRGKDRTP